MIYTLKAILVVFFMSIYIGEAENITCDELLENIVYEGIFFSALDDHTLNSPFLNSVTAYIYNDEIYAVATDFRDETNIYCNIPKDDWVSFEKPCNCSYSKKFEEYIASHNCDCSVE